MDELILYVYRYENRYNIVCYFKNGYLYIENEDIFLCLTQMYKSLKTACDRERVIINKNSVNIIFVDDEEDMEKNIITSYDNIYNLIF